MGRKFIDRKYENKMCKDYTIYNNIV
jgi:hypothetical protein